MLYWYISVGLVSSMVCARALKNHTMTTICVRVVFDFMITCFTIVGVVAQ
jgi:hypothetical protein